MTSDVSLDKPKKSGEKRFYGRRQGRPLNTSRQKAMDEVFPRICVSAEKLTEDGALDPKTLFPSGHNQYWLEIGFGGGEHVHGLLRQHDDIAMLAAEPFINGMASFCKEIDPTHMERARVIMDDAMYIVRSLGDSSIERIYILNPDPWHKKRHHKRRIVSPDNLDEFARILKPGGQLIMTTDVPYLAEWMGVHTANHNAFEWQAQSANDWKNAPQDWLPTRYEVKGAKGADQMAYLIFDRK